MSELDNSTTDQADTNVEQTANTETGQEGTDSADYNSNDALDGLDDSALADAKGIGADLADTGATYQGESDRADGASHPTPQVESGGDGDSPARGRNPDQDGPQR